MWDAITEPAAFSPEPEVISFFTVCRRLCARGKTIFVVAHSAAFEERLLVRLRHLCDAHLILRVEKLGPRMANTLEVSKVENAELVNNNIVSFEVKPGIGMQVLPMSKVKA